LGIVPVFLALAVFLIGLKPFQQNVLRKRALEAETES
jgi:hypothetical protein